MADHHYKEIPKTCTLILGKMPRTKWRRMEVKFEERWWARDFAYRIKPLQDPNSSWPDRVFPGGWYWIEITDVCAADMEEELNEWMKDALGMQLDKDYDLVIVGGGRYHPETNTETP